MTVIKVGSKYRMKEHLKDYKGLQISYLRGVAEVENYAGGWVEFSTTSYPGVVQSMSDDNFVDTFDPLPPERETDDQVTTPRQASDEG